MSLKVTAYQIKSKWGEGVVRIVFLVSALFQVCQAWAGEMVLVPNDYNLIELPIRAVVRIKKETILAGSSTSIGIVDRKTSVDGTTTFHTCTLNYLPSAQRRVLPANLDLYVSNITKKDSSIATPGYCWKNGLDKTGSSITLTVQSNKGFQAEVSCYSQSVWTPPQGEICRFNEIPTVGDLTELAIWADADALKSVIEMPL